MRGGHNDSPLRRRGEDATPVAWLAAGAVTAAAIGLVVPLAVAGFAHVSVSQAVLVQVAFAAAVSLTTSFRLARRDWFHPLAFPVIYLALILTLPIVYIVVFNGEIGAGSGRLSVTLVLVYGLTLLGVVSGVAGGMALSRPPTPTQSHIRSLDYGRMLTFGRLALVIALLLRLYEVSQSLGQVYGYGAVTTGLQSSVTTTAAFLFFGGVVLVTISNTSTRTSTATPVDALLILLFIGVTLFSGSRGELIAPTLFVLWAHHTYVRSIPLARLAALTLATVFVFQGVAGVRSGEEFLPSAGQTAERLVTGIGTPVAITSTLIELVPNPEPYRHGGTYLAAVERQLPGPISVALLGPPDDTASFVYRDIIGFRSSNAGFGFSLPSEGYLNFGLAGVFLAALVLGLLIGGAYRKVVSPPTRALHLFYPILIVTLPLNFRSDALGQIKTVLYPMILLAFAYAAASYTRTKQRTSASGPDASASPRLG